MNIRIFGYDTHRLKEEHSDGGILPNTWGWIITDADVLIYICDALLGAPTQDIGYHFSDTEGLKMQIARSC